MKNETNEHDFRIVSKTLTVSVIVIVSVCIILLAVNITISIIKDFDKVYINFDYFAIIFMFLAFASISSFSKSRIVYHLIIGIGFCLTFVCMLVLHFVNLMA